MRRRLRVAKRLWPPGICSEGNLRNPPSHLPDFAFLLLHHHPDVVRYTVRKYCCFGEAVSLLIALPV